MGVTWGPHSAERGWSGSWGDSRRRRGRQRNSVFVKLDSRYTDYFPEYAKYFGIALMLLKSMYGMTNSGKLFSDELTEWLIEAGFIQYQC